MFKSDNALRLISRRIGALSGSLVASQLLNGLIYVVAARQVGPRDFGVVAVAIAVSVITVTLYDLGLNGLISRDLPSGRLDESTLIVSLRLKRLLVPIPIVTVTGIVTIIVGHLPTAIVVGISTWFMWEAQTANAVLRANDNYRRGVYGQVFGRLAGLLSILTFLVVGLGFISLPAAIALAWLTEWVIDGGAFAKPADTTAKQSLIKLQRSALPFGLTSLSNNAQQLDTPLVSAASGAAIAGLYAAAGRLLGPLGFLSVSMSAVIIPWLARNQHDPAQLRSEEERILKISLVLSLGPLLAIVAGPLILPILLGEEYSRSGLTFSVLAVGAVLSTVNQALCVMVQNRNGATTVAVVVAGSLVAGLLATYVLAKSGDASIAALGYVITQASILVVMSVRLLRLRSITAKID